MKRIVVGAEGTGAGDAAVQLASTLCQLSGAELVIGTARPSADGGEDAPEPEHTDPAGIACTRRQLHGEPGDELVRLATDVDADLVAIGVSPAADRRNRVARHLLHHLHQPLAVVPMGAPTPTKRSVVVGVDGSRASEAALQWAIGLARDVHGDVTAVFAHDPLADSFPHPDIDNWTYHGGAAVQASLERTRDPRVDVDLVQPPGRPDEVLTRVADLVGAAAIVVGTRGRGGLHGRVVGRVPLRLVEQAARPVVVVPH